MENERTLEAVEEALMLANYELGRVSSYIGNISSLLLVVIEQLEQDDSTSYYGGALYPIAMMLQELSNDTCQYCESSAA